MSSSAISWDPIGKNDPSAYQIKTTKAFRKDVKRMMHSGYDIAKLEKVVSALCRGETLHRIYHDHVLKGQMEGINECHIEPDWLLMYQKQDDMLVLILMRTGTHDQLFGR